MADWQSRFNLSHKFCGKSKFIQNELQESESIFYINYDSSWYNQMDNVFQIPYSN